MEAAEREPSQDRRRPSEAAVAMEGGQAGGAPGLMLDAQARLGNHGATALAQRMGKSGSGGHGGLREDALEQPDSLTAVLARRVMDPSKAANASFADADAFKAHGPFGPTDVIEGTVGGLNTGGFEATYDPGADQLNVVMRCAIVFKDTLDASGTPADPNLTTIVNNMPPPGPARTAYIAQYQWVDAEKPPWLKQLESSVEGVWGGKHEFFVNKPDWEWVGAKVDVDIQVHERNASGGDEHLSIDVFKFPTGESLSTDGTQSSTGEGQTDNARDQTMTLSSTDVGPRPDNMLFWQVHFGFDSANLGTATVTSAGSTTTMTTFVKTFNGSPTPGRGGSRPANVVLEAHASQSGSDEYNKGLAQRRADAVRTFLTSNGFRNVTTRLKDDIRGEAGANPIEDANDRRVDMLVDGAPAQNVAAHEFGHAFGLDDEYATDPGAFIQGTGANSGTAANHDPQTKAMTDASGKNLPGAVHENNSNIMSMGNTVGAQHYSMFHAALVELTGMPEWALGPKKPRAGGGGSTPAPSPLGPPAGP